MQTIIKNFFKDQIKIKRVLKQLKKIQQINHQTIPNNVEEHSKGIKITFSYKAYNCQFEILIRQNYPFCQPLLFCLSQISSLNDCRNLLFEVIQKQWTPNIYLFQIIVSTQNFIVCQDYQKSLENKIPFQLYCLGTYQYQIEYNPQQLIKNNVLIYDVFINRDLNSFFKMILFNTKRAIGLTHSRVLFFSYQGSKLKLLKFGFYNQAQLQKDENGTLKLQFKDTSYNLDYKRNDLISMFQEKKRNFLILKINYQCIQKENELESILKDFKKGDNLNEELNKKFQQVIQWYSQNNNQKSSYWLSRYQELILKE